MLLLGWIAKLQRKVHASTMFKTIYIDLSKSQDIANKNED